MEKYQHMRSFITAVADYTKHPSEAATSVLQRNLGVIGVSPDLSIFDPAPSVAAEFYVSLHELMNLLGSRSPLIWNALDVLQNACKNSTARKALIHTYQFAPILTRLLETNLTPEKKIRVLKLLQDLTYGVKLSWQEAYPPYLITPLTQWIVQSKDEQVVALSLGILVNLCYKNLPALYTLLRTVDTKTFIKSILNIRRTGINTKVQCCKMMIILESMSNSIPDGYILEFVKVTFSSLITALENRDAHLLRQIVDFFNDVRQAEHSKAVIVNYQDYPEHVAQILSTIDLESDHECVALTMEFFTALVSLKLPSLLNLYKSMVKEAMKWIPIEAVATDALALIRTITIDCRRTKIWNQVFAELDLSILILVADSDNDGDGSDNEKPSAERQSRLAELVQLLQEISMKQQVAQHFGVQAMRRLLRPVFEQNDSLASADFPQHLANDPATTLYIHALALTANLAAQDSSWLTLYTELLQKKQIQMVMALGLYRGDAEVKRKILQLTSSVGFSQDCISAVTRCMCELEPLVLIQNVAGTVPPTSGQSHNAEMAPLFSFNQESRLDAFLAKLEEAYNNDRLSDMTASAMMEFYDYKLAAMRHAERATQARLEAANDHATSLQHRLAQVIAESSRLHQLLFHSQQCLDGLQAEKASLNAKLLAKDERMQEIPNLKKIVAEKSATIDRTNIKIAELNKEVEASRNKIGSLEEKLNELSSEKRDLKKQLKRVQESINKKDQIVEERDGEITAKREEIAALKQEIDQLNQQCQIYQQRLDAKEEDAHRLAAELTDLSRMRDMIFQLTAAKKAAKKDDPNSTNDASS